MTLFLEDNIGYLSIILGPMFSGKTTKLINIYNEYRMKGKNPLVINYIHDTRYNNKLLSSHDKIMIPCTQTENLMSLFDNDNIMDESSIILINEGQFFPDLYEFTEKILNEYKKNHLCLWIRWRF